MTVSLGTVASANAYSNLAPCLMMPPNSCAVPGKKPGTSTKVTSGMLKQSQKRTNRAAFTDASMSRQPARCAGWFATTPTGRPSRRANPTTMLGAYSGWISKRSPSSTTRAKNVLACRRAWRDRRGMRSIQRRRRRGRRGSRVGGERGRILAVVLGQEASAARAAPSRHARSSANARCATPERAACVCGAAEFLLRDLLVGDRAG